MSQLPPDPPNTPDPTDPRGPAESLEDSFQRDLPRFTLGQCVVHRRYGYRGVIVDFDMACHADADWYKNNQTQPDIEQPWYHVLVHDSTGNTYVAQENLIPDATGHGVKHPLVGEFFDGQYHGTYVRNDAVWPSWQ